MDDGADRFDWTRARGFLATAQAGSYSAAARQLGLTQPTLGRQVAALERELGVALFERVGRGLELTPAGRDLLPHVQAMRDAARRLSIAADSRSQSISGTVSITASEVLSLYVLPPILTRLRAQAPGLQIDLVAADDIRDLQRREADIAIRHVRPDQPELIARLISEPHAGLYAARNYLERRGLPARVADLATHDFVSFGNVPVMLGFLRDMGLPVSAAQFPVGSASGVVSWGMVRQGLGLAVMSDHIARYAPEVVPVLRDQIPPVQFPVWLTTHRELHSARRIRLVFDLLAQTLGQDLT